MDQKARCVHCRVDISVPESYADGDHIKCGSCDTQHRVVRNNNAVRLVIADATPVREALRANQQRRERLATELKEARASLGIGINGALIGLLYVVAKIALEDQPLTKPLIVTAALLAVGVGMMLELANFLFLQKRRAIKRLTEDIATLQAEAKDMQRMLREAESSRR